jgi:hypothetical protein
MAWALRLLKAHFQERRNKTMKKFLGAVLFVGAFVTLVGAAVAQMEHGSGHGTHGAMANTGEAGHEMNCPMAQAGQAMMKSHMAKAGPGMMKNQMGKAGHDMQSHKGQAEQK